MSKISDANQDRVNNVASDAAMTINRQDEDRLSVVRDCVEATERNIEMLRRAEEIIALLKAGLPHLASQTPDETQTVVKQIASFQKHVDRLRKVAVEHIAGSIPSSEYAQARWNERVLGSIRNSFEYRNGPEEVRGGVQYLLSYLAKKGGSMIEEEWMADGGMSARTTLNVAHYAGLIRSENYFSGAPRPWVLTQAGAARIERAGG